MHIIGVDQEKLAALTPEQRAELDSLLADVERRRSMRYLETLFPDTGPLRRELYPKHMQFFAAGATKSERVFMAGNRCLTPWTFIQTGELTLPFAEALALGDAPVRAMAGAEECDARLKGGFLKGIEPAFRLVLGSGQFFDCTRMHRVLTTSGWLSLDQLVRRASGLRCWHTAASYQASCVEDGYLDGQLPRSATGSDRRQPPLQGDVQQPAPLCFSHEDAMERTHRHNRTLQGGGHLTSPDDLHRLAGLFAEFSGPAVSKSVRPLKASSREALRILFASTDQLQSCVAEPMGQSLAYGPVHKESESPANKRSQSAREDLLQSGALFLDAQGLGHSTQELFDDAQNIAIFFPRIHPELVGGEHILAVVPLGYQPIIDGTVPIHENYRAAGVYHHNTGKTLAAGAEHSWHLTGLYPDWWVGRRITKPYRMLASGDTHETTRDILQLKMLGSTTDRPERYGTGLIPGDQIIGVVPRPHVKGAVEKIVVAHWSPKKSGTMARDGESEIWLRSYVQGREIFQGFELDGFWPDEECPQDVYEEGQIRLMTTGGISTLTFTPLQGLTALVQQLTANTDDPHISASREVTTCGWDEVPHLDDAAKATLLAKLAPHQRQARTQGVPALGAGAIYPVDESDIAVDDFQIPQHWARSYGLDVGWNRTAAIWSAHDRDADVVYLYSEHYRGQAEPSVHAAAIRARGADIPGAIDPASRGRGQADGSQLLAMYQGLGLNLTDADNGVESGIYEVLQRLSTGRLKVFKSCQNWFSEYRIYRRNLKGAVVKENDHLMDATRYVIKTGLSIATTDAISDDARRIRKLRGLR